MSWRRALKNERCGFCVDHVFKGGEPVFLYGSTGLPRCAAIAKARYGVDVPVPFPEPEVVVTPYHQAAPDFITAGELARSSRYRQRVDAKQRQTGEAE